MSVTARVRVPATTANLGPGFDALGIALRIANTVTVTRRPDREASAEPNPMIDHAAAEFFQLARTEPFPFDWNIRGAVPRSRGLGSSVTVRLGILHGLNAVADNPATPTELYELCTALEGHPDNAAPAAFGGFVVARRDASFQRFRVASRLKFVLLIPDFEMETAAARCVLPTQVPLADAVTNLGNTAAITAAFASANYLALSGCFEDTLHQPYRAALIPCLEAVIAAGKEAGALGGWLSGSGSTIACVTTDGAESIAAAMTAAANLPNARTVITTADNRGVRVLPPAP